MSERHKQLTVTIPAGAALSEGIDMRRFTAGFLFTPAAWTAANIGFQAATEFDGTYTPLRDAAAAAIEASGIAVDSCYALPAGVGNSWYLKLWSKNVASEADVNQVAAAAIVLQLKRV